MACAFRSCRQRQFLTLRHLRSQGVGRVLVVSRAEDRAEEVTAEFGGEPWALSRLAEALPLCDIVVASTAG